MIPAPIFALAASAAVSLAGFATPTSTTTAAIDPLPHPPQVEKLDNGLTVVTVPFDSPGIVSYYTLVKAGSRDEVEPGKSGYAHLFEHLMFRGTDTVSSEQYAKSLESLAADTNAFTSSDLTIYVATLPNAGLSELIKLESDRFQHLHVAADKYKDETGAVLGEFNKSFANPGIVMDEALRQLTFKTHTYGHTTIGLKRDVEDMPNQYEYSKQFFKRFYTPDDCVVYVVGDFDRAKVMGWIKDGYGGWKGTRAVTRVAKEAEQKGPREKALTWRGPTEPRIDIAYRIPATGASLKDAAAYATVAALAFAEPSELYQRLVVKEQKALELDASPDDVLHKDSGLFEIEAKLKTSTSFAEIVREVQATLDGIGKGGADPKHIDDARNHLLNALVLGMQTPGDAATRLARMTAVTGDPVGVQAYAKALSEVTADDVARVAKTLVPAHRDVVTMVAAPAGAEAPAKAVKAQSPKAPGAAPASPAPAKPAAKGGAK